MTVRVLHVNAGNLYGGVETILTTLARYRHLCPEMEPHFALCFEGRLSQELKAAQVPVRMLGNVRIRQPLTIRRARRLLSEQLKQEKPNVLVCHSAWQQAIFGPVATRAGLPLASWLHDRADGSHWLKRWAGRSLPAFAICNSRFTATSLSHATPKIPARVIYCPVARPPEYSSTERLRVRAEANTPPDATVIIQVSRIEAWKGHRSHFEALGQLLDIPNWVCWIVGGSQRPGEARYFEELQALALDLGIIPRIRFLGQRTDVPQLLAAADIYCQPNTKGEPFGIGFIEALYSRLPVVTTALGGALEIVDDSCGLLVKGVDVNDLAAALRRLLQDRSLREQLGKAGPARASALCDPQAQLKRIYEAFRHVRNGGDD